MSDQVGNQNVGFLMTRLISLQQEHMCYHEMLPIKSLVLVILSIHMVCVDLKDAYCACSIYVNGQGFQEANCLSQKLTTIPHCVPNTTEWLNLGHNDIRYSPGQFQKFGNLVYLNMFANKFFVTHTDSFRFLFSLKVLNLGYTTWANLNNETFQDQSKLLALGLSGEFLQLKVSQSLFDHLVKLETLDLSVKISLDLPNWSFVTLPSLLKLDLHYISVLVLHNHTFSGLSALKYLYLHDSLAFLDLPVEVFKPLISLEELHLEGLCSVPDPSFDCTEIDERIQHIPSLKRLFIDKSLISHLGKGFLLLKNLEELYLVDSTIAHLCGMSLLKTDVFTNLNNSPVTKLVLSLCNINNLVSGWFKYLTRLKEFSLSITTTFYDNFWVDFTTGLEITNISIVRLSLSPNNKYFSKPKPFTVVDGFNETKLTYLELTDTLFYCINDNIITRLPKSLAYLNLTHNYIIYFGVESLNYLENLETLDLSNQVDFHEESATNSCDETLELSHQTELKKQGFSPPLKKEANIVQRMNQSRNSFFNYFSITDKKCLSLPYRLKTLDLSKSSLLCNMVRVFCESNNSLSFLNASTQRDRSCFTTRSFWSVLKNLANLVELNLNGNWIFVIPRDAFSGLYKLRKLILFDNKLLELSFDAKDLISLEILDVSGNSIQCVSNSLTGQIEDVSRKTNLTIYLNINPLVCNCKQLDFVIWLVATQVISNKHKLNCTFENGTRISLGKMSHVPGIMKYKCTMLDVTIGCIVIFCGLNIILGGLAYILHNRKKLRYLVLFGRRTLNPYHPIEEIEIQMEYDVYISYEGDFYVTREKTLRDFVIYTLLPGLEQRGVRVMIRYF